MDLSKPLEQRTARKATALLRHDNPVLPVTEERIARRSLHEEVVSVLRDSVVEGRLAPGERLNERMLCDRYGISRTPLREAFKVLAAEGLLNLLPSRGAVVASLTRKDLDDTVEVLAQLEVLIGNKAAIVLSDADIDHVRALHHEMCSSFLAQDIANYFRLNQSIHLILAERCGNTVLFQSYHSLNAKLKRYRFMANQKPDRWRAAVAEHEDILRALVDRNGEALGKRLQQHLLNKAASVREMF